MEKNIYVVDEKGNEYEATYPRRAKGLVKNGRARFVSKNKICLACPPKKFLEDKRLKDKLSIPKFVSFASGRMTRIAKDATETNFKLSCKRNGHKYGNQNKPRLLL